MTERPILFNDEMVRALLEGRKTQTRRVIKLKTGDTFDEHALSAAIQEWRPMYDEVAGKIVGKKAALIRCPYGQPGDRLWVRETWAAFDADGRHPGKPHDLKDGPWPRVGYAADGVLPSGTTRPSIHMPRWACRLLLEVTDVRVERLQDITEVDAQAEGASAVTFPNVDDQHTDRDRFRALWNHINGAGSWDANPWVWVVEFKRIDQQQEAS